MQNLNEPIDFEAEIQKIRADLDRQLANLGLEPEPTVKKKLDTRPATATYRMGALVRRTFRRDLMALAHYGITFREEKGLVDSMFYVRGKKYHLDILEESVRDWIRRMG